MAVTSVIKKMIPTLLRPLAVAAYLRGQRLYFAAYRRLFRPNPQLVAVAEQNHITWFPPEWTSVCIKNADILVDLETDYEFDLEDVRYAYSGHTIEHLSDTAAQRLLNNLFRVMGRGAVLRIECPDLDMILEDYRGTDRAVARQIVAIVDTWGATEVDPVYTQEHVKLLGGIASYRDPRSGACLPPVCSLEEFNSSLARLSNEEFGDWVLSLLTQEQLHGSYEHRNWFNFRKLERFLTAAGFSQVVRCRADETRHRFKMNINRGHRSWCSVYVEAIKQ